MARADGMDDVGRMRRGGLAGRVALLASVALLAALVVAVGPRLVPRPAAETVTFRFRGGDADAGGGLDALLPAADVVLSGTVTRVVPGDPVEVDLSVSEVLKGGLGDRRHARAVEARGPVRWTVGETVVLCLAKSESGWTAVRAAEGGD
jgi:hypothetical protein